MALVESGFNPRARSRAGARGLWQFIPSTGKRYGLRQVDDFYDVRMATEAASEYLLDLIGIFGSPSFLMATAAYNAGEGRIQKMSARSRGSVREAQLLGDPGLPGARDPRVRAADHGGGGDCHRSPALRLRPAVGGKRWRKPRCGDGPERHPSGHHRTPGRHLSVADLRAANSDMSSTASATPARNFPLYVPRGSGERVALAQPPAPPPRPRAVPPRPIRG